MWYSVSIVQKGTSHEPLDVSKNVDFDVLITGVSRTMLYTVEMAVEARIGTFDFQEKPLSVQTLNSIL
jgi:hypothetical protein